MSKMFGVLYASRESQTEHIAEHIGVALRARNIEPEVMNVREPGKINLNRYCAVVLAASVHGGKHEREMIDFVKTNRSRLMAVPSVFLSVSLSEAGVERSAPNTEKHKRSLADVQKIEDAFIAASGWPSERFKAVAGALPYTRYNFFVRFIMKRIAEKAGEGTDTSRDYEYTDWVALDEFITNFAENALSAA